MDKRGPVIVGYFVYISSEERFIRVNIMLEVEKKGGEKKNKTKGDIFAPVREERQHISDWLMLQTGPGGVNHIMLLVGGWVQGGGADSLKRRETV